MINCIDCKYYSSNPYLSCAVNPMAVQGCEMGEVGEPLNSDELDFPVWPPELYVDWHNGERINVNELTGIDRDLVLMGVRVDELEEAKRRVASLARDVGYQTALGFFRTNSRVGCGIGIAETVLRNLGRLP